VKSSARHNGFAFQKRPKQPRKHAAGCQNRRQPYNGSAATAGDCQDLTVHKGRLLQTRVMPGRHDFKYRQRGPELTESTPVQGTTQQSRAAPRTKLAGSETRQHAKTRWRHDDESVHYEAGHSRLRWHVSPAALQTHQVTIRNPGEASASPGATENTRRSVSEQHDPEAPSSAAHPVGRERDVSGCLADDVVCGRLK
jgi:hypothetical protein